MDDPKKKPGLALVIEAARKGKSDSDDEDAPPSSEGKDEDYSTSLDELADVVGVPDDKREAFSDAFRAAVMACSK